jgi:hypothetical protein
MKKIYMIPTLTVVKIQPTQLMIPASGQYDGQPIQAREARFSDNWDEWDEE